MLIWPRQEPDTPYGHVAVIVDVSGDEVTVGGCALWRVTRDMLQVFIAEQNWHNTRWPGAYSRTLQLKARKTLAPQMLFKTKHKTPDIHTSGTRDSPHRLHSVSRSLTLARG